jgi:hypothetical protein
VAFDVDWVRARLRVAQEPVVSLSVPELGYLASGSLLSVPYYAGGLAVWKYLNWEAMTPSGTSLLVRLRTADTEAELGTAEWVEYSHTGQLVTNAQGCWAQYELLLATSTPTATPALDRMILYYDLVPTAVTLASFTAMPHAGAIRLDWETASELDNLGFNLYRSDHAAGPYTQLNEVLIPSQAPGSMQGAVYTWEDRAVAAGTTYYYKLESVDSRGRPALYGPVTASPERVYRYAVYLPLVSR